MRDQSVRGSRAWSLVAVAVLAVGGGREVSASAITILPLGDSITYGYSDPLTVPGGYRGTLFRQLSAAGYTPQFVGSQNGNPDPTLPAAAQSHEGHIGYLISGDAGYASFSIAANIDKWLAPGNGVNPDLVLLELGSNEVKGGYHKAAAPYELAALVTRILQLRPSTEVLLSTITPQAIPGKQPQVDAFNQTLSGPDGVVAQLQKRGEKVVLVNAGGSLAASDLAHDGLHLNAGGYVKLANAWFQAIEAVSPPPLGSPTPAPEPSTLAILGVGVGALGLIGAARRRNVRGTNLATCGTVCERSPGRSGVCLDARR